MILALTNKKHSQALIELIIGIALTVFFLSIFIVNVSFITNQFSNYKQKAYAYEINTKQKEINDRNVAYFLADHKIIDNYATNNYFGYQGSHLSYTYLNYVSADNTSAFLNQEKIYFLNDDYIYYWSLDAIPSSSTFVVDDKGDNARRGIISCTGESCANPIIMDSPKGECVSNNCILFQNPANTAGTISFPSISDLNIKAKNKTTWEAWVNSFTPQNANAFMSRGEDNYFGTLNLKAVINWKIGSETINLMGVSDLIPLNWYHLAATYDGTTVKLYVNGVLENEITGLTGSMGTTDNLKFGYFKNDDLKAFNGYLDEVKIYGRALDDNEILNHYRGYHKIVGLLANWHLDDALNVATYNVATEVGINPRFTTFSTVDNVPILVEKASAINNATNCISGSCVLFNRDFSSKGILMDSSNNYPKLHNPIFATLSANIKLTKINSGYQGLIGKDANGNYALGLYDNDVRVAFKISGTRYTETYDANLDVDKWYKIDTTFDGTNIKLYIDGVLKSSWEHTGSINSDINHSDIYIAYSGSSNEYFDGYIDNIKIYNRALSIAEINNNNGFDNSYTYFQYFKPVCRVAGNETIGSECLNCNPINSTECTRAIDGNNFEPFLIKSIHITNYGNGYNYQQLKNEQVIPIVNSFYQYDAGTNVWGAGFSSYVSPSCGRYVFGTEGYSSNSSIKYNSACGDPACGREIIGAETCASSNISYHYSNGCTTCSGTPGMDDWTCDVCTADGYFEKTNASNEAYFISPTFNFPKKVGLISLGWIGSDGPVQFQLACVDDMVNDENVELPESSWIYLGPTPTNAKRCSSDYYYSSAPNSLISTSSCWETDNQTLYNCHFFRFKVKIASADMATVNSIRLNFGQYPYTIIK